MALFEYEGRAIRLTEGRWHISEYPEMTEMRECLEETLREPETVVKSPSDSDASALLSALSPHTGRAEVPLRGREGTRGGRFRDYGVPY